MMLVLSGGFTVGVCIWLAILSVLAVCVLLYLVPEIMKYAKVNKLNGSHVRDKRFASGLLSVYFKKNVIENPYLLRTDKDCRPDADVVVVCEGGIVVISVEAREGYFVTPKKGVWTVQNGDEVKRIPNLFERGMYYVNACSNIAKRNGISCPIYNLVLLSDDNAEYDEASGDSVLTNDILISCIRSLKRKEKLTSDEVSRLVELFKQNDSYCRKLFVESAFDDGFIDKSEPAPAVDDTVDYSDDENDDGDNSW